MRIAILSTSLEQGGAAIVTQRLADALSALGHDIQTFTVAPQSNPFFKERLEIFIRNGLSRKDLFKVSTARYGKPDIVSTLKEWKPDVVILGWINQGMLSLKQLEELGRWRPLVWIMHDMWNMTGICHHSLGCMRFKAECGNCRFIRPLLRGPRDLSRRVHREKQIAYDSCCSLTFVAVSRWLGEMASLSSLLGDRDCRVIPNVFPIDNYRIAPKEKGLVVIGAARLNDPIKGLRYAIEALNRVRNHELHVVLFGELRNPEILKKLKVPYSLAGTLSAAQVAELCSRAEAILSTSLFETLPTTLIEGQASGCIPVSFNRGGQLDIIDHLRTGWLAPFGDIQSIADGIDWALSGNVNPEDLRQSVARKFGAEAVARRYEKLLIEILKKKP